MSAVAPAHADAGADPSAVLQSRAELEANLAEYQGQLDQVRVDSFESEREREKVLGREERRRRRQ